MEVEVEEQVDDELGLFLLSLVQGEEVSLSLVQGEEVSLDQGEEGDCTVVDVVSTSNTLKGLNNEHFQCWLYIKDILTLCFGRRICFGLSTECNRRVSVQKELQPVQQGLP